MRSRIIKGQQPRPRVSPNKACDLGLDSRLIEGGSCRAEAGD